MDQDEKIIEMTRKLSVEELKKWVAYWQAELAKREGKDNE